MSKVRGLELALLLLGFTLTPGLLDALAHLLGFAGVHRFTTTPSAGATGFPAAERARQDGVTVQHIPAVRAARLVAFDTVAAQLAIRHQLQRFGWPQSLQLHGLQHRSAPPPSIDAPNVADNNHSVTFLDRRLGCW